MGVRYDRVIKKEGEKHPKTQPPYSKNIDKLQTQARDRGGTQQKDLLLSSYETYLITDGLKMSCIYPETLGIRCKSVGKVAFERAKRKPLFSTLQLSTVRALCISSETSSLMLHSLEETQVEAWLANLQTLIPRRSLALIYENLFHHEERWQGSWLHPWSFSRTNQMKLQ